MSNMIESTGGILVPARRALFANASKLVLSGAAVALLAGKDGLAATMAKSGSAASDCDILNVALGLEQEAIMAYQLGAESGLLKGGVLDTAVGFQSQHKEHAAALEATIKKLGGMPVMAKPKDDYAKALGASSLKTDTDVLKLAAKLEKGAANAYLGVIPSFSDPALAQVSGRLAADETMHWTVLATVLKLPLPTKALTFGA